MTGHGRSTRWLVVGGGGAGCVVAARLSEDPTNHVTLVEAGPDHGAAPMPGDVGPILDDPARIVDELVVRRPGRHPEPYAQGFGLGGSSLINGSVVVPRDPPLDHVLPTEAPWADGSVGGALLASHPLAERVRLVRRDGRRVTAADAYLRPATGRPNLIVRTGSTVRRVTLDGRRAIGLVLTDGAELAADRVVLCAGAIRTPTILLRSGVDTPGVGQHLQDHPTFTVALALRPDAIDATSPTVAVGAWGPTHHVLALNHLPGRPDLGAVVIGLHVVGSTGRVTLPDPDGEPLVELDQFGAPEDLDRLAGHVGDELALLEHPAWGSVVEAAFADDRGTSLTAIGSAGPRCRAWIGDHAGGHLHVAGTCAEGRVTDGGAVRGYEQLYVCDASSFRVLPSYNPYLHVVALAERTVAAWRAG